MRRTLEHCSLITKYGKPNQYDGKCEGFQKDRDDDEPCEQCMNCKFQIFYDGNDNEMTDKYLRSVVVGVIADTPKEYKKGNLLLQRSVDKGGDSVLITASGNKGERTAYLIPTEYLKQFLNEPL